MTTPLLSLGVYVCVCVVLQVTHLRFVCVFFYLICHVSHDTTAESALVAAVSRLFSVASLSLSVNRDDNVFLSSHHSVESGLLITPNLFLCHLKYQELYLKIKGDFTNLFSLEFHRI